MLKRIHRGLLHKELGLPGKLHRDFHDRFENVVCYADCLKRVISVQSATIVVLRGPPLKLSRSKSSAHRVFIKCERCSRLIPVGRYHQHYGTLACK